MKPRFLLQTMITFALIAFSSAAFSSATPAPGENDIRADLWTQALCMQKCHTAMIEEVCTTMEDPDQRVGAGLQKLIMNNSDEVRGELRQNVDLLTRKYKICTNRVKACSEDCPRKFPLTVSAAKAAELKEVQQAERISADRRIRYAEDQLRIANQDPHRPGDDTPGIDGTPDEGSTADAGAGGKKANDGLGLSQMMPLLQAGLQMLQQQQQQQQQLSCGGPNSAPGCPPTHICFTNPSSIECKCGPYGPGGPECGRPFTGNTERNMGTEREREIPPPPLPMGAPDLEAIVRGEPRPQLPVSQIPSGQGGGALGNSASTSTPPKKKQGGSYQSPLRDLNSPRGFMSSSGFKTSTVGNGPPAAAAANAPKKGDPRTDPSLQGAHIHYGRMLQAGAESARRRAASMGGRQALMSKEVRPASDNIFKAVNEAYQAKGGTFLR